MNTRIFDRCVSLLTALVMLLAMSPSALADASSALSVRADASSSHVYIGEGAVDVTVGISGGTAPYEVTLQAVKDGAVLTSEKTITGETSMRMSFSPVIYGMYEMVVSVHDAAHVQEMVCLPLYAAEHDEETAAEWAASVSGASLSGDWAASLLSVARTQVGYRESEKDFVVKNGVKQGYTRYGAWFGLPWGDWNNAFLAFAAAYAGIPDDALLSGAGCRRWISGMTAKGAYEEPEGGYTPRPGDVAFLSGSRAAVIEQVSGGKVTVIEGDADGEVARKTYAIGKLAGIGNTRLLQGLHDGTATAVPAQTAAESVQAATPSPMVKPTATPEPAEENELTFQAATPRPGMTAAAKAETDPLAELVGAAADAVTELRAEATSVPAEFSEAYGLFRTALRALAERYLGEGAKIRAEVRAFVQQLTLQEAYYIRTEMEELDDYGLSIGLTVWEGGAALEREETFRMLREEIDERWQSLVQNRDAQSLLDGHISISADGGEITVTGEDALIWSGSTTGFPFSARTKTYTVTIVNNDDAPAVLTFDWSCTGLYKIFGSKTSEVGTSGSVEETLEAGGSYTFEVSVQAPANTTVTGSLTLTNIALTTEGGSSGPCTLVFDASLGSVTADGTEAVSGSWYEAADEAGLALSAQAAEGCTFLGWVDAADGSVLSQEESFTLACSGEMTVAAAFARDGGTVWFGVSDRGMSGSLASGYTYHVNAPVYLFDDLTEAVQCASAGAYPCIMPMCTGTLPAGAYAIPSGVTLLIPFDAAGTIYLDSPASTEAYTTPSAYRTLTLAAGAELTVSGALSVSSMHRYAGDDGGACPTGTYGQIALESGSSIVVEDGGRLYAWGYITGAGEVTALSGAAVYEYLQIMDFRGAVSQTMKNAVYPFSQGYVQSIEAPLRLYAGAKDVALTSTCVSGAVTRSSFVLVGEGGLLSPDSGYILKDYLEGGDRLSLTAHGSTTVNGMTLEIGGVSVDSREYVLPVNSNITLTASSGTLTLGSDLALLPGAEIIIGAGAECVIAQGASVYVYDADEWDAYAYSAADGTDAKLRPVLYAPGRRVTRTVADLTDACLTVQGTLTAAGSLYTTAGGAAITGADGAQVTLSPGTASATWQLRQSEGTNAYKSIPVTPAQLKNADGSYALTANAADQGTYTCMDGSWLCGAWQLTEGAWQCTEEEPHMALVTLSSSAATCADAGQTEGVVCSVCGLVISQQQELSALGHSMPDTWTETAATCSDAGEKVRSCQREGCTYQESEEIPALGHSMPDTWTETAATCSDSGEKMRRCQREGCTYQESEEIPALGHSWAGATCAAPKTCLRCGETEGEAREHDWSEWADAPGEAATCTEAGREVRTCLYADCGEAEYRNEAALWHDIASTVTAEATCEQSGATAYSWCQREGCSYVAGGETIPPLGHEYRLADGTFNVTNTIQAATCTLPLVEEHTCVRAGCGKVIEYTGASLGHDDTGDAATCTQAQLCRREGCNAELAPATGHAGTTVDCAETPATCEVAGYEAGVYCTACETWLSGHGELPALGHRYARSITTEPGCETAGAATFSCTNEGCSASYTAPVAALGHTEEAMAEVGSTCTADGSTGGRQCTVCGTVTEEPTVLPAVGHQAEILPAVAATCSTTGLTEGSQCTVCKEVLTAQRVVSAKGHNWAAATCENPKTCKRENCGATEGEPLGHTWLAASCTAPATCRVCKATNGEAPGHTWAEATCTTAKKCSTCGTTEGSALGHTRVIDEAVAPICTEAGLTAGMHCSTCGVTLVAQHPVSATGHANKISGEGCEPTCTEAGLTDGVYCPDCSTWVEAQTEIPALGHSMSEGVVTLQPTCTQAGTRVYTCKRLCGYKETEIIPAAHTPETIAAVAPTESTAGSTEGSKCAVCGEILVWPEVLPATGTAVEDGWHEENGGWRYYLDGVYLTGVSLAEGLYYDFGTDGVSADKVPYTGLLVLAGQNFCISDGMTVTGWQHLDDAWYWFDETTGAGPDGDCEVDGRIYAFEGGRLIRGAWAADDKGLQYFDGPECLAEGWYTIDGADYYFTGGYAVTGAAKVPSPGDGQEYWYQFNEAGVLTDFVADGLYWHEGELYYLESGSAAHEGLYCIDGQYYNFLSGVFYAVRAEEGEAYATFYVYKPNDTGKPEGVYRFDNGGRAIMTTEVTEAGGMLFYYEDGVRVDDRGLILLDGAYYYITAGRAVRDDLVWVEKTNALMKKSYCHFDGQGRMITEPFVVLEADGEYRYYNGGPRIYDAGLVEVDGAYYYILANGTAAADTTLLAEKTNGLLPDATYAFGADARLLPRTPGDANEDGVVDLQDVTVILAHAAGEAVPISIANADVTADGLADASDALRIMQYASGWAVELN